MIKKIAAKEGLGESQKKGRVINRKEIIQGNRRIEELCPLKQLKIEKLFPCLSLFQSYITKQRQKRLQQQLDNLSNTVQADSGGSDQEEI